MASCSYTYKNKTYIESQWVSLLKERVLTKEYKAGIVKDDYLIIGEDAFVIRKDKDGKIIENRLAVSKLFNDLKSIIPSLGKVVSIYANIKSIQRDLLKNNSFIDENGEPLLLYHGTNVDFEGRFKDNRRYEEIHDTMFERYFFMDNLSKARSYGEIQMVSIVKGENITEHTYEGTDTLPILRDKETMFLVDSQSQGKDGVILNTIDKTGRERQYVSFNPENIFIVGKIDKEGFKQSTTINEDINKRKELLEIDTYYSKKSESLTKIFTRAGLNVTIVRDDDLLETSELTIEGKDIIITVNGNKLNRDTLMHEFGHLFIDLLDEDNPYVKKAYKLLKNTLLYEKVKGIYPDYSENRLLKEVLTYAIGDEGTTIFENQIEKNLFLKILENIYYYIAKKIGIGIDPVKQLARDLLQGIGIKELRQNLTDSIEHQRDIIDDIDILRKIKLDEKNNVYTKDGKQYNRLTEFIFKTFSSWLSSEDYIKARATAEYNKLVNSGIKQDITEDQIREQMMKEHRKNSAEGKIVHHLMEYYLSDKHPEQQKMAMESINVILNDTTTHGIIDRRKFQWLFPTKDNKIDQQRERDRIRQTIMEEIGSNIFSTVEEKYKDVIEVEVPLISDKFNIGTTFDIIVRKHNGDIMVIDWKSGRLRNSEEVLKMLKYGENKINNIPDNPTGRASLELIYRILVLKYHYPETKFSRIALGYINNNREASLIKLDDIDIQEYLFVLRDYFKENNPELFKELNDKKLFDANIYEGTDINAFKILDSIALEPLEVQREIYINQLNALMNSPKARYGGLKNLDEDTKKKIVELQEIILQLEKIPGATMQKRDDFDIGLVKSWVSSPYDFHEPTLNKFYLSYFKNKTHWKDDFHKIKKELNKLLEPIAEEYFGKNYLKKKGFIMPNIQKAFGFAYVYKKQITSDGIEYNGITLISDSDPEWNNLTDAQKKLITFIRNTMNDLYVEVVNQEIYQTEKGITTKGELLKAPERLPNGFFPLVPIEFSEFAERQKYGIIDPKSRKEYYHRNIASFLSAEKINRKDTTIGTQLPLKYSQMWENGRQYVDSYTLNLESSFLSFIDELLKKKHMDSIITLGEGMRIYYQTNKNLQPNKDKWVNFVLNKVIRQMDVDPKWMRKPLKFTFPWGTKIEIDPNKLITGLRNWTTATTMWLNIFNAGFNTALIMMQNHLEALKGSIAKDIFGVPPEDVHITMSKMLQADALYMELLKDFLLGRQHKNKLYNMAYKTEYLTDNYDYKIRRDDLIFSKNKLYRSSFFYVFYKLGEDYGNYTILAAQLLTMKNKKTGKSMWESYNDQGEWIGGTRGKVLVYTDKFGKNHYKDLQGLEPEEVLKLSRVSQRLFGSYRQNEMMMIEQTAIGRFAMQFKKYLPQIMANMFQGRYDDMSLGYYTLTGNKIKDENGNDIDEYTWQNVSNEGRMRIFYKWMFLSWQNEAFKEYKWKNMTAEDKQSIISMMLTSAIIIGSLFAFGIKDDKDENTPMALRLKRLFLEDIPQGTNPFEIVRAGAAGIIGLTRLYKLNAAFMQFIIEGVILGKRTQDKGRIPGSADIRKYLPFMSIVSGWERFVGEDFTESEIGKTLGLGIDKYAASMARVK